MNRLGMNRLDLVWIDLTWTDLTWHEQTRLTDSGMQLQYTTRDNGNMMATYSKQYRSHDKNQPMRKQNWEYDDDDDNDNNNYTSAHMGVLQHVKAVYNFSRSSHIKCQFMNLKYFVIEAWYHFLDVEWVLIFALLFVWLFWQGSWTESIRHMSKWRWWRGEVEWPYCGNRLSINCTSPCAPLHLETFENPKKCCWGIFFICLLLSDNTRPVSASPPPAVLPTS